MLNIKTISLGLLIGLSLAVSILAYTGPGKKLARLIYRRSDIQLQALTTCPEQFERLSLFARELKRLHRASQSSSDESLISMTDDQRLLEIIAKHQSKIATLEEPINNDEHFYYEVRRKRIAEDREIHRQDYYKSLNDTFPELMQTCIDTLNANIEECDDRFAANFSVQADCENFYSRRLFWQMLKHTPVIPRISSERMISLEKNYGQSFSVGLQALTTDPY